MEIPFEVMVQWSPVVIAMLYIMFVQQKRIDTAYTIVKDLIDKLTDCERRDGNRD
jgi:hypothetical protein